MNTTYASKVNPQFQNAGTKDVAPDLSLVKSGMDSLIKENENELKALESIAQDQAQIDFNRGAAKLVDKYGTDFKGLDKALLKLENDLYGTMKPTHPAMAENLLRQYDAVRLRAVERAKKTYKDKNNQKVRGTSRLMVDGLEAAAASDFLIYLGEISTKSPEERKPENIEPFLKDLQEHNAILERRDMDGNPIFTDTEVASRKGMKGIRMNAASDYIQGMTLEQLENWYNTTFQSEQFRKDTGFSAEDMKKLKTEATSRIAELKKDTEHKIKVRAVQETADLINNGGDMMTIDRLKKEGQVPEKLIDETVKTSNKIIEENWYDPKKTSDPTGLLKLYSKLDSFTGDTKENPDADIEKLETFVDIMNDVNSNKKELNLDTEKYREYMNHIKKSIVDKDFANAVQNLDVAGWSRKVLEENEKLGIVLPALAERKKDELSKYESQGVLTPEEEKLQKTIVKPDFFGKRRAQREAVLYADQHLPIVMSYLDDGMYDAAKNEMDKMRYNVRKIQNSYWLPPEEMDRLEEELKAGKKPLYYHNGATLEYNGASGDTALFKLKME